MAVTREPQPMCVVPKEHGARVIYEIQRDGNTIKIKAKTNR